MKLDNIDNNLFLNTFNKFSGKLFSTDYYTVEDSKCGGTGYFKNPINFNDKLFKKSKLSDEVLKLTDLYPVNICIIDYLLKNSINKDFGILDFGCGIPHLLYHLNIIGYKNVYGHDNWVHIEKNLAVEYIEKTNMPEDMLLTFKELLEKKINILCHVGCALLEEQYEQLLTECDIQYILADYRFTPIPDISDELKDSLSVFENKIMFSNLTKRVDESQITKFGFEIDIIYDGLLVVYKKI